MTTAPVDTSETREALYHRTVAVVMASQVFSGAGLAAGVTVGALLAADMRRAPHALPVTALEQVLGSCLEVLGTEHLEAEGVGEPVGRVDRDADRQRVLDLLA